MDPDGQTDGMDGRTDGRTHGRRQNYIPLTSSAYKKSLKNQVVMLTKLLISCLIIAL